MRELSNISIDHKVVLEGDVNLWPFDISNKSRWQLMHQLVESRDCICTVSQGRYSQMDNIDRSALIMLISQCNKLVIEPEIDPKLKDLIEDTWDLFHSVSGICV